MSKKKKTIPLPRLAGGSYLVDTHCHLDMRPYADLDGLVGDSRAAGVQQIITIGIDLDSSKRAIEIAERYEDIYATVGVHPHNVTAIDQDYYDRIKALAGSSSRVVGFGEIGMDMAKKYAPAKLQKEHYETQLQLAKELRLPVIIHDRDAHDDIMALLTAASPFPEGGVMHCFSGDADLAKKVVDLGFFISIPGIVTFHSATMLQEVVKTIPLEHMLLETDGPFLAPVPMRGKTNQPSYLPYTAQKVADLCGRSLETVADITTANARKVFGLAKPGGM